MFGSMVGSSVAVAGMGVAVAGPSVGVGKNVPVGVQGIGWKGVGVADAFGAAVTYTNGSGCAWAAIILLHPVRMKLANKTIRASFLIY
jgi:hypothetical protein